MSPVTIVELTYGAEVAAADKLEARVQHVIEVEELFTVGWQVV